LLLICRQAHDNINNKIALVQTVHGGLNVTLLVVDLQTGTRYFQQDSTRSD